MKRVRFDIAGYLVLATVVFAAAFFLLPGDRSISFHVFVLAIGGILMLAALSAVGTALPHGRRSELGRALDAKPRPDPHVSDLARVERAVTLGVGNAHDLHARLLPMLRDIAAMKLERAGRRADPDSLGRWWDLLRPDRAAPVDRFARGIPQAELRDLVADLERM